MAPTALQAQQEEDLVRRVQGGDDGAFDRLVDLCAPRVYALALRMMGNAEDAQDIAQDAFVRVYQAISKFRNDATFSTWLYRIVTNVCHDELARRKRRPMSASELENEDGSPTPLDTLAHGDTPEATVMRQARQEAIQQALTQLPEQFRLVVILHDIQGFSYQEIAEITKVELGTVKSRLNRARLMLREKISANRELFGAEISPTS